MLTLFINTTSFFPERPKMDKTLLLIFSIHTTLSLGLELEVINEWNFLDFNFPYDYGFVNSYRWAHGPPRSIWFVSLTLSFSDQRTPYLQVWRSRTTGTSWRYLGWGRASRPLWRVSHGTPLRDLRRRWARIPAGRSTALEGGIITARDWFLFIGWERIVAIDCG